MKNIKSFFALLILVLATLVQGQCGNKCRFRICRLDGTGDQRKVGGNVFLGVPNTALSAFVCRKFKGGSTLGRIIKTDEPIVSGEGLSPTELKSLADASPKFRSRYFRLFTIPYIFKNGVGIGRKPPKGNQEEILDGKCIVLPITEYESVTPSGKVVKESSKDPKDCVSFTANTGRARVALTWNTFDDFDLVVVGPYGTEYKPIKDFVAQCDSSSEFLVGRESVAFDFDAAPGTYTIKITHKVVCKFPKKTNYLLRVSVDGNRELVLNGKSNREGDVIVEETFEIPPL